MIERSLVFNKIYNNNIVSNFLLKKKIHYGKFCSKNKYLYKFSF